MPIYEYKCETCGETFEEMQKFSDDSLERREGCKKSCKLKKLISAGCFHLKGSGWYVTDFKGEKKTNKDA